MLKIGFTVLNAGSDILLTISSTLEALLGRGGGLGGATGFAGFPVVPDRYFIAKSYHLITRSKRLV